MTQEERDKIVEDESSYNARKYSKGIGKFFNDKPNIPLYQYTNAEGLLGILKSEKLWQTKYNYFNDISEMKYGMELIKEVLSKQDSNLCNRTYNTIKNFTESDYVYIVSFCEEGDLLSMWRGYGNGGQGCCISFNFMKSKLSFDLLPHFCKVLYEKEKQEVKINDVITYYLGIIEDYKKKYNNVKIIEKIENKLFFAFYLTLIQIALIFKNPAFQEEKEWRFFSSMNFPNPIPNYKFRTRNNMIIPYIEMGFDISAIEEIIVGPGGDVELIKNAIDLIYQEKNQTRVKDKQLTPPTIKPSKIPYR